MRGKPEVAVIREQIVTSAEEMPEVLGHLAGQRRLGFDTEFVGEDTFRPDLCLIQVATPERLILIDPLSVGPLDAFWSLLVADGREVIVHAGREEARLCQAVAGKTPTGLFDTQVAAGLVGHPYPMGHGALVAETLGIRLNKSETLTDWRRRPLTRQQVHYAFDDVRHLLELGDQLAKRLEGLNRRDWAEEEFARLASTAANAEAVQERWRRLPGLGNLRPRQLAIVRELYQWRQDFAAQRNRPPRAICRDDLLVEIARKNPSHERDLHIIRGVAHRLAKEILDAVERARRLPAEELPAAQAKEVDPPQVQLLGHLLSAILAQLCQEMELAQGLACSASDVRALARGALSPDAPRPPTLLDAGWRARHVKAPLEAVLRGERTIRIVQPQSATPLELAPWLPGK